MTCFHRTINLNTKGFPDIISLDEHIIKFLGESGLKEGLLTVFVPGSTAGITTIEYEPGLLQDLPELCRRLAPSGVPYHHDAAWQDGNGYAHILAALFKPSLSIPFGNGKPLLGTWQQVVLMDFDNRPRRRQVILQSLGLKE